MCIAGAYSPGKPAAFLANYAAAMEFLKKLEAMCTTKAALQVRHKTRLYAAHALVWIET